MREVHEAPLAHREPALLQVAEFCRRGACATPLLAVGTGTQQAKQAGLQAIDPARSASKWPVAPDEDAIQHAVLAMVVVESRLVHARAVVDDQHVPQSVFVDVVAGFSNTSIS